MKLLFALSLIITVAILVRAQAPPRVVKVSRSDILSHVAEHKKKQPGITTKELAAYANELLGKRGFDYDFNADDIVLSAHDRKSTAMSVPVQYRVSLTDGAKRTLKLELSNPQYALCGEHSVSIPSRLVNKREIHLIADGKTYRVRRPAAFLLEEVELVDANLKALRRWEMPYQSVPIGISVDGTKLYLDFYTEYELDDLILELSEGGRLAFRDRAALDLKEGTWLENFPKDPNNSYLSFKKFEVANKTYIIRFTAPCT